MSNFNYLFDVWKEDISQEYFGRHDVYTSLPDEVLNSALRNPKVIETIISVLQAEMKKYNKRAKELKTGKGATSPYFNRMQNSRV